MLWQLIWECQSVNNLAYFAIQPLNLDTNFVLFNCPPSLGCAHQMKMKILLVTRTLVVHPTAVLALLSLLCDSSPRPACGQRS